MMKNTITIGATISAIMSTTLATSGPFTVTEDATTGDEDPALPLTCVASDFSTELIDASIAFITTDADGDLAKCKKDIDNIDIPFDVISMITIDGDKIVIPEDVETKLSDFLTDSDNVKKFCESTSCLSSLTGFESALNAPEGIEIPNCTIGMLNPSTVIELVRSTCASLEVEVPETAEPQEPGTGSTGTGSTGSGSTGSGSTGSDLPDETGEEPETCVLQDFEDLIDPGKKFLEENAEILGKCQESLDGLANPLDVITSVQLGEDGEINFPDEVVQQLTTFVIENTDAFCGSDSCSGALVLLYDAVKDLEIPDCLINDLVNPSTIIEEVQKTCSGDYNVATDFNLGTKDASKDTTDASAASSIQQVSLLLSAVVISLALML